MNFLAAPKLNGTDLGNLWKPPYRVDITGVLKEGINMLEIEVVNLWVNRLIGDEYFPSDAEYDKLNGVREIPVWVGTGERPVKDRVTFSTWRFYTKDSPLIESGLLGPVTIDVER
ncbi:MAG: hypothetical protein JW731_00035 [Bacteroidales bacterium]|nr:hypothetical protein [Bacteroidales bacterium]